MGRSEETEARKVKHEDRPYEDGRKGSGYDPWEYQCKGGRRCYASVPVVEFHDQEIPRPLQQMRHHGESCDLNNHEVGVLH